jgi:hypothetical protein
MTEHDDRESNATPSGPPEKKEVWLPPRLRDKMDTSSGGDDDDFEIKPRSPLPGIITTVIILGLIGAGGWFLKTQADKSKAEKNRIAAEQRAAEVADSLAKVQRADSIMAVRRADSLAFAALPKWKQLQVLREKAAAGDAAAQRQLDALKTALAGDPEAGPFGIDAGQYIDDVRASQVADELKASTGLDSKVVTRGSGDNVSYHVVLGRFDARPAADAAARQLLARNLIRQGLVVTIK